MVKWINLNWNKRSVVASCIDVLHCERKLNLSSHCQWVLWQAGRQIRVNFEIFKILYWLNCSDLYSVSYQYNVTIMLAVHFSLLFSSKAYLF